MAFNAVFVWLGSTLCLNKKLCCCRGTARRAMLVNSRYVLRGMGVRKVSNYRSDLQGHSRSLATVPFNRPHMISCYCFIATMSVSSTVKEILSLISLNLKRSRDTSYIPFGVIYHACASTPVYQSRNEIWSTYLRHFQRYDWGKILKNGSRDSDHAPFRGWFVILRLGYDIV